MLRPTIEISGRKDAFAGLESEFAAIATTAMRGAAATTKQAVRDQLTGAGLGGRLANAVRGEVYPGSGNALNPAGWVYATPNYRNGRGAAAIIDAFDSGATIVPLRGKRYLWIPTRAVPRAAAQGRASSTERMRPDQLLKSFGLERFIIRKGKGQQLLAFIAEQRGVTARGKIRKVRKGRLAHGDDGQLKLMYTLVPNVTLHKRLDLNRAAEDGAADFVNRFEQGAR